MIGEDDWGGGGRMIGEEEEVGRMRKRRGREPGSG